MSAKLIRLIVYAIGIAILYVVLGNLYERRNDVGEVGKGVTKYVVKLPSALKNTYLAVFILGLIMFVTFLFFRLKGNLTVTDGHLVVGLIVMGIGLLVMIFATKWRIIVNENQLEVHRHFSGKVVCQISELDRVEIGSKKQMILYKDGKKITTVNFLADNYDNLKSSFEQNGKLK